MTDINNNTQVDFSQVDLNVVEHIFKNKRTSTLIFYDNKHIMRLGLPPDLNETLFLEHIKDNNNIKTINSIKQVYTCYTYLHSSFKEHHVYKNRCKVSVTEPLLVDHRYKQKYMAAVSENLSYMIKANKEYSLTTENSDRLKEGKHIILRGSLHKIVKVEIINPKTNVFKLQAIKLFDRNYKKIKSSILYEVLDIYHFNFVTNACLKDFINGIKTTLDDIDIYIKYNINRLYSQKQKIYPDVC